MSEDEVRALMWQMLQALQYLHGVAVWHRYAPPAARSCLGISLSCL